MNGKNGDSNITRIILAIIGVIGVIATPIFLYLDNKGNREANQTAEAQAIAHTQTKEAQLSAVPPTETSTQTATKPTSEATETPYLSPGVQFLAFDYFDGLNNEVTTIEDLEKFWELLSDNAQDKLNDNDINDYKGWWWDRIVKYKLYKCSDPTVVVVDLDYYNRDDYNFNVSLGETIDLRFELTEIQGNWLIYNVTSLYDEGHHCDFVYGN